MRAESGDDAECGECGPDHRIAEALVRWFRANRRDLPWRHDPSPYAVWVSEIMLQQTQVTTVIPYFRRFLERFPSIAALAGASETEVLKAWEGLGYYARARNLHQAARDLVRKRGGVLPDDYANLRRLKGLGDYAAAAVASIAFGVPVPSVDGNVLRVAARLFAIHGNIRSGPVRKAIFDRLEGMIRAGSADPGPGGFTFRPGEFNEALMELGATVCVPKAPRCPACPLEPFCEARKAGVEGELPRKSPKPVVPLRLAVCAVVTDGMRVLVRRRASRGLFGGLWEFPWAEYTGDSPVEAGHGAASSPGETNAAAGPSPGERSALNVLISGLEAPGDPHLLGTVEQAYSHFRLRMKVYRLEVSRSELPGSGAENPVFEPWENVHALPLHGIARKVQDIVESGNTLRKR